MCIRDSVRTFNVEAKVDGNWQTIAEQTTIGYKRILRTERVEATALRINITDSRACPLISTVEVYNAPVLVKAPAISRDKEGRVTIVSKDKDAIFYTLDGTEPTSASEKYTEPFMCAQAAQIKAIAFNKTEKRKSETTTANFGKAKAKWNVLSVSGNTLDGTGQMVDGNPSSVWTSTRDNKLPMTVVIDMGEKQKIKGFTYMPRQTGNGLNLISQYEFYTSTDKKNWTKQSESEFSNIRNNPVLQEKFFESTAARYLKLVAKSEVEGGTRISIGEIGIIQP
jgi:alpha-L-fucosidase